MEQNKSEIINIVDEDIKNKLISLLNEYNNTKDTSYIRQYLSILEKNSEINIKESLLSKIGNTSVFNILHDNNMYISNKVKDVILSDTELVKMQLNENKINFLKNASGKELLKDIDGSKLIELFLTTNVINTFYISGMIKSIEDPIIIDILNKYNRLEYMKELNENVLFSDYNNEKVIDYLFQNNMINSSMINRINNPIIYNYIIKYNKKDLLKDLNEKVIVQKIDDKYILDLVINEVDELNLNYISSQLFNMINERKKYDLLKNINSEYTLTNISIGGKTMLEILIENGIKPNVFRYTNKKSVDILVSLNEYEELQKCSRDNLLIELPNGKKIYEELFDRGLSFKAEDIDKEEIIENIIENKRYDLYSHINTETLLKQVKLNETYLDRILEEENAMDILKKLDIDDLVYDRNLNNVANVYIIYARHNKEMYLKKLTKERLLSGDDKRLIDILIELDQSLISKIIPRDVKRDMEIAMILKLNEIDQKSIKFDSLTEKLEDEYINNIIFENNNIPLNQEQENLLENLKVAMNDGLSDPSIINSLISVYRRQLGTKNICSYEIIHLLNVKKNIPQFAYKKVDDGSYYDDYSKTVSMEDASPDVLAHETGHALFHLATNKKIPDRFNEIINKLRNDPSFLEKTSEYSKKTNEIMNNIEKTVEETFMKNYDNSITSETKKEIENYLVTLRQEQKEKYLKNGYGEETLDIIFDKTFTVEEYIKQDREIKKESMINLIFANEYPSLFAIGDFIDGIYKGEYFDKFLTDSNGNTIEPICGHGIYYYNSKEGLIFDEMIANLSSILKSKNSMEGLNLLKEYIGEELFNFLNQYYFNEIIQSKQFENEKYVTL